MNATKTPDKSLPTECAIPVAAELSQLTIVELKPEGPVADYRVAMQLANAEAEKRLGDAMLLSWYDRDRDFESPQHASECHQDSATPGYVDYGIHHGATLKVDIEQGRFVFFYLAVDL
ncbi:MAG: AF1514 family protein [Gammaproteobacteria bacterium]